MMKYPCLIFLLIFTGLTRIDPSYAQTNGPVFMPASDFTLVGKLLPTANIYHRLDTAAYPALPSAVKKLLTNSAGLALTFNTNSTMISARWTVSGKRQLGNMTAIANKGLDLYIKKDGRWQYAGAGSPFGVENNAVLVKDMDNTVKECLLYMPLYDEISSLQIGVDHNALLKPGEDPFKKRILIYGSSIVQGASASRPGLAYPARLSRETGLNFLNLGLSGSAKMEKAAAAMVASIPADAYILDCVPNSSPEQITERTAYFVSKIRAQHPDAPVIIVQSIIREQGNFDETVKQRVKDQNANMEKQFSLLRQKGIEGLYLITSENMLGQDHEGTTDGVHPNDLGFDRMIQILKPEILTILGKYNIHAGK